MAALYAPNLSTGFTGKDKYRPWGPAPVVVDGSPYFANGWDQPWRMDPDTGAAYNAGSTAPTTFVVADAGGGTTFPITTVLVYYLVFRNSSFDKETAPQQTAGVPGVTHTMTATRDALITWTDPGGEWDKVAIYRRLQQSDNYKLVDYVAASAATYTDDTPDSGLETATTYTPRYRATLPPIFAGMVSHLGRLWGWTGGDANAHYAQLQLIGDENVADDFPDSWELQIGVNDGRGPIVSMVSLDNALLVLKTDGAYEVQGEDVLSFVVRERFSERGAISHRCVVQQEGNLVVLDKRGLYAWSPGSIPRVLGATENTEMSPLQPLWDRMNLDAASTFFAVVDRAQRIIRFHIALDYEPVPSVAVVWDYGNNRFVSVDTLEWGTAGGTVRDGSGYDHTLRIDDLSYVWEENYGAVEGVLSGSVTATITAYGSGTDLITASAASFDVTAASGIIGAPFRRYSGTTVLDSNRVYSGSSTTIVPYYFYAGTAPAASQTLKLGVIPARGRSGKWRMGTDQKKHWRSMAFEFDQESSGTVTVTGGFNDNADATLGSLTLSGGVRGVVSIMGRARTFAFEFAQDDPNAGFTIRAVTVYAYSVEDRRP